jgi:hypothetical protein
VNYLTVGSTLRIGGEPYKDGELAIYYLYGSELLDNNSNNPIFQGYFIFAKPILAFSNQ